jgi:hypothetical protein
LMLDTRCSDEGLLISSIPSQRCLLKGTLRIS